MTEEVRVPAPASFDPTGPVAGRRAGAFGTGLPLWELIAILTGAVALFLFWDGPLWSAPPGSSHMVRILISYLAILPLVVAALLVAKRWSVIHLLSSVALLWSCKLVITASLYTYFASGSVSQYSPAQAHAEQAAPQVERGYRPLASGAAAEQAEVAGLVTDHGAPLAGALVLVESPPPGLPLGAGSPVQVEISGDRFSEPLYVASVADPLSAGNRDAVLHTVRVTHDGRAMRTVPVPPGTSPPLTGLGAGIYQLTCEHHPGEHATLVIADHPYVARTDGAGRFVLHGVPAGPRTLLILRPTGAEARRTVTVSGPRTESSISFSEGE